MNRSAAGTRTSRRRPRHVVLIALYFPPSRASGVYRALAMANYLARHGYEVSVITVPEDYHRRVAGSSDPSLLDHVDTRIRVERVSLPDGHLLNDVRDLGWWRVNAPRVMAYADAARMRLFPDRYNTWIPGVIARAMSLHLSMHIDAIIATGNPWSAFEAGRIAARLSRSALVLDFRDSWSLDVFSGIASSASSVVGQAEGRLVAAADLIYQVNAPILAWYRDRYPSHTTKFRTLINGHDLDEEVAPRSERPQGALRVGCVGTLTEHWPLQSMWEGWAIARQTYEYRDSVFNLHGHLGFSPRAADRLARLLPGRSEGFDYCGAVPRSELASVYAQYDILVLPVAGSRYVTSGKVYEYMATGRPIVAIYERGSDVEKPLAGYPLAFPVTDLSPDAVASAFLLAARAARRADPDLREASIAHSQQFRRDHVFERLAVDLEEVFR